MLNREEEPVTNNLDTNNHPSSYPDNWQVYETADQVARVAVEALLEIAKQSIKATGAFHLVTAGGTTPLKIYQQLASLKNSPDIDWSKWHIYMGDERCLPEQDTERNSLVLQQAWLNNSLIPKENQHFMPAELGAEEAVNLYEKVVSSVVFDLVLLGMGEDGHTASLFPRHTHNEERYQLVISEYNSPKPPLERVSLSQACLCNSNHVIKLITGQNKQEALKLWLDGVDLPIKRIEGIKTQVLISKDSLPIT